MIVASRQALAPFCLTGLWGLPGSWGGRVAAAVRQPTSIGVSSWHALSRLSADTGFRERGAVGGSQEPPRLPDIADASAAAASGGFGATALHRFRDELGDVRAGFSYIGHSSNRCALLQTLTPCIDWLPWLTCEIAKALAGSLSHLPAQSQKLSASQCTNSEPVCCK